ncbi:MAG TPA: secretin N-terminal domain-containing protein [Longimicrobiales bacterium]|nr:secretin N-terminal domain-containing protein [Longimicrobiales bacterium]
MTAFIAFMLTLFAAEPAVTGLSVAPVADRTEVVILVDGTVTPRHFMMPDGRLVVDLTGVPQAPRIDLRDFNRGGVRELRVAPFQANVARVVLALGSPVDYDFVREGSSIRISFRNPDGAFEPWSRDMSGGAAAAASSAAPANRYEAPAANEPPAAAAAPRQQIEPVQDQDQERIRAINFVAEPVNNVLAIFSDYAGQNIVAAPGVQSKTITATLTDVTWREALDAILEANGMFLRTLPSGVMVVQDVASADQAQTTEPLVTRTFAIRYISADSISRAVEGGLLSPDGRVTVNPSSNTLLITDTRSAIERISQVLPELDVRTPQVDITAVIAFIDRTALEAYGVVYDLKDSRGNQLNRVNPGMVGGAQVDEDVISLGGNSIAALGNANYRVASPSLEIITSLVLGRHTLISFIEALQTVSLSDVQAKPVVRTMDHRRATIQVGEQTPIRVIDAGAAGAGGPLATVEYRNTGIILEVTPHIIADQVLLDMRAERSGISLASSDIGVIFQTQNAQTQVLVNDGETVVIGGLTITEKTQSRAGIPILMDLPVVGTLFRQTTEQETKRDLLIMVTPHIVRE